MTRKITFTLIAFLFMSNLFGQDKAATDITYKIVDGDTLKLRLIYPEKYKPNKKYPTIVFFFGGGWNGGTILQFEDQAKYFATRGVLSALVDYRVKSRHKTTPYESVKDAKSAMRFLRSNAKTYGINTKKMVAAGGSAGGHLAAAVSMLPGLNEDTDDLSVSSKASASILYNAVIDNGPNGFQNERMGDRYLEISPMHNIKDGAPPAIFFLGDKDKLIPVNTAYEFKTKMEAVGSRCDVFIYKDQPHGFFNKGRQENDKCYIETTREADVFLQSIGILKGKESI